MSTPSVIYYLLFTTGEGTRILHELTHKFDTPLPLECPLRLYLLAITGSEFAHFSSAVPPTYMRNSYQSPKVLN